MVWRDLSDDDDRDKQAAQDLCHDSDFDEESSSSSDDSAHPSNKGKIQAAAVAAAAMRDKEDDDSSSSDEDDVGGKFVLGSGSSSSDDEGFVHMKQSSDSTPQLAKLSKGKDKDKDGGGASLRRYWEPTNSSETCFNCGGIGHRKKDCTNTRKARPCYLCGQVTHPAAGCPNALCFRCHQPGHQAWDCSNRPIGLASCYRCNGRHSSNRCPSLVMYCLGHGTPCSAKRHMRVCCNCGKPGHFSDDCQEERMEIIMTRFEEAGGSTGRGRGGGGVGSGKKRGRVSTEEEDVRFVVDGVNSATSTPNHTSGSYSSLKRKLQHQQRRHSDPGGHAENVVLFRDSAEGELHGRKKGRKNDGGDGGKSALRKKTKAQKAKAKRSKGK